MKHYYYCLKKCQSLQLERKNVSGMVINPCLWFWWGRVWCFPVWTAGSCGQTVRGTRASSRWSTGTGRHLGSPVTEQTASLICTPLERTGNTGHSSSGIRWTSQPMPSPWGISPWASTTSSPLIKACIPATFTITTVAYMKDESLGWSSALLSSRCLQCMPLLLHQKLILLILSHLLITQVREYFQCDLGLYVSLLIF